MSKAETYLQTTIFDAINLSLEKKNDFSGFSKNMYQFAMVYLCKLLITDNISLDEYKASLHNLLQSYRKDYKNA